MQNPALSLNNCISLFFSKRSTTCCFLLCSIACCHFRSTVLERDQWRNKIKRYKCLIARICIKPIYIIHSKTKLARLMESSGNFNCLTIQLDVLLLDKESQDHGHLLLLCEEYFIIQKVLLICYFNKSFISSSATHFSINSHYLIILDKKN